MKDSIRDLHAYGWCMSGWGGGGVMKKKNLNSTHRKRRSLWTDSKLHQGVSSHLISVSNGLMNGEPRMVWVLTMWSSRRFWMSSTDERTDVPVSRYEIIVNSIWGEKNRRDENEEIDERDLERDWVREKQRHEEGGGERNKGGRDSHKERKIGRRKEWLHSQRVFHISKKISFTPRPIRWSFSPWPSPKSIPCWRPHWSTQTSPSTAPGSSRPPLTVWCPNAAEKLGLSTDPNVMNRVHPQFSSSNLSLNVCA